MLRLLKLGKLLRVTRIVRMFDRYAEYLRAVWSLMGGWILSVVIFFLSHVCRQSWLLARHTICTFSVVLAMR